LEENPEKIDWNGLSLNPKCDSFVGMPFIFYTNAMHILEENTNAMHILE